MLLKICLHHKTCWLNISSLHCRTCNRRWERGVRGPWGKWGHLGCWRGWGTRPARQREERAVGIRQWRRLAILKMLEGTGDGLGITSSHVYAKSTYHICIMCCNLLRFNNHNCELCFTVPICFRRINHMAVKKHLHSSSVVQEVVSSTGLAYWSRLVWQAERSRPELWARYGTACLVYTRRPAGCTLQSTVRLLSPCDVGWHFSRWPPPPPECIYTCPVCPPHLCARIKKKHFMLQSWAAVSGRLSACTWRILFLFSFWQCRNVQAPQHIYVYIFNPPPPGWGGGRNIDSDVIWRENVIRGSRKKGKCERKRKKRK